MQDSLLQDDPRVKALQSLAWGLQTASNKPGEKIISESFKRECYTLGSRAVSLCADVRYLAEADFAERAEAFTREIEAKKIELAKVEEQERRRLERKCLRPGADGGYEIADKARRGEAETPVWQGNPAVKVDESHRAPTMTFDELVARCRDDPEALWLSNMDMQDGDMELLSDVLKRCGAQILSLDLSHNRIGDAGVQRLVSALAGGACPQLRECWFGGNSFDHLGLQMLRGLGVLRKSMTLHTDVIDAPHEMW